MKSKLTFIRLIALILILELGSIASPAFARTQDNGQDPVAVAVDNKTTGAIFTSDTASQINDFVGDVKNFAQNELLNPLGNLLNSALGAIQIPDLNKVLAGIMNGSVNNDPGAVLSETLENKTNGQSSYSIREDLGKYATRTVATGIANQATLSQTAQSQMAQIKQATQQDTQENVSLGEESQSLDVTQQILQNLSQQTAITSRVNERILQEAQQARIDRALSITITAQTDQGIQVGRNGRIPTNAWFASLLLEPEFAKASLPKIAALVPSSLFSGQMRSTTIISYLSEPRAVRPGEWEIDMISTRILVDRTTGRDERIPFNRTFTVQAVEIPRSSLGKDAPLVEQKIYEVRSSGLQITKMVEFNSQQRR